MAASLGVMAAAPVREDPPVSLWGGLSTGMSQSEVEGLYPAAVLSPNPQDSSGYLTTLAVRLKALYGEPVLARFRFRNKRLAAVRLDLRDLRQGYRRENIRRARDLIHAYSTTYSDSYDCNDNSYADTANLDCKWVDKGLTIQLEYLDVAGQAPTLKVVYSPTADVGPDL